MTQVNAQAHGSAYPLPYFSTPIYVSSASLMSHHAAAYAMERRFTPKPMVARTVEDILAARGVKPTLSPNLNVLATIEALPDVKRLLFIGVGCQVRAACQTCSYINAECIVGWLPVKHIRLIYSVSNRQVSKPPPQDAQNNAVL